jgi:hypothetical protein
MAWITIADFTVGGRHDGEIDLPCDGVTAIDVVCTLRCLLFTWEHSPVSFDLWVGQEGVIDKDLVRDQVVFAGPLKQWITVTHTYTLVCSAGCQLAPGVKTGGLRPKLTPGGSEMDIRCAYWEPGWPPGFGWQYGRAHVKVKCVKGLASVVERDPTAAR